MKLFLIYTALVCSIVASCQNANTNNSGKQSEGGDDDDDNNETVEKKNISKRDYSITKAISYSNLFFR